MRNSLINFHTRAAGGGLNPAESSTQASTLNVSTSDPIAVALVGINDARGHAPRPAWIALGGGGGPGRGTRRMLWSIHSAGVDYVAKNFARVFWPADRSGDFPRGKFGE